VPEDRPFRFGLQLHRPPSRDAWVTEARRAEDVGFDVVVVPDHVLDGSPAPLATLGFLAGVTERIRVGTMVLNNDFRHPALLAREAAMVDLLSDGRLELGLGAGHAAPEYRELGLDFDPAARRVERLEAAVGILRRLFDGETVTVDGPHYRLHEHRLSPVRRPVLFVGGNGDRVLRLAAAEADSVGFTGLGPTRADGQRHEPEWSHEQIDAKVDVVRAAARSRRAAPELSVLVQHVAITPDREQAVEPISAFVDADPRVLLAAPFLLLGTTAQIVDQLFEARARWGFSYFVTRDAGATAPIIEALRDVGALRSEGSPS
jgi:probable F420-dependent oxidoreductase